MNQRELRHKVLVLDIEAFLRRIGLRKHDYRVELSTLKFLLNLFIVIIIETKPCIMYFLFVFITATDLNIGFIITFYSLWSCLGL
jgi:hypothetical protein